MAETPKIAIAHLAKSFGAHAVLKGVSLAVPAGGVVALIGPSGIINDFLKHLSGAFESDDAQIQITALGVWEALIDVCRDAGKLDHIDKRLWRLEALMIASTLTIFAAAVGLFLR